MAKYLTVFFVILYVALNSVAYGFTLSYVQPDKSQSVSVHPNNCQVFSAEDTGISYGSISTNSVLELETSKDCISHIIVISPALAGNVLPFTLKRAPALLRRLIALQPFNIEKPPRVFS